jgi:hypothetical protein
MPDARPGSAQLSPLGIIGSHAHSSRAEVRRRLDSSYQQAIESGGPTDTAHQHRCKTEPSRERGQILQRFLAAPQIVKSRRPPRAKSGDCP